MTTLADRPNTALLIVDVQTKVVANAHDRDAVIGRIGKLVEDARAAETPVIWVRHENEQLVAGTDDWQIAPELKPLPGEPIVAKRWGDTFEDTNLEALLAERKVGRLVVAGAMTDQCIRSTLHGAFARGYDTLLVKDAHTTEDMSNWGAPPPEQVIAHTNIYWKYQSAPGRTAGTAAVGEVAWR